LDTGAPGLVLNITYFRHYPTIADEERNGVTGEVSGAAQTIISHFSFEGRNFYKTPADLINLGHIEDIKGVRILGLIGMSFIRNTELIIDYEKSLLYIHFYNGKDKNSYKNEMLQNGNDYSIVPIEIIENKIVVYPTMAGRKMKFLIDTGAESNILDTRLPNKVFENVTITRRTSLAGTGNKKVEALYGDMKNMKIGKDDIGTLPVIITNLQNACITPMCCVDGMLGFDFLSLHKIGFNFAKQEMYIWK
jgi:hypothetical protein